MISEEQHYLIKLAEEASEIIKDVSKALIFGLNDIEPNKELNNKQKIENEVSDLLGVIDLLCSRKILDKRVVFRKENRLLKVEKISKWLKYSKEIGITAPYIIKESKKC